jgi:hypothetical protein
MTSYWKTSLTYIENVTEYFKGIKRESEVHRVK